MIAIYPNPAWAEEARGRLSFLENGRDVGIRFSFSPTALIGIRIYVPRYLGTASAFLSLWRDGEEAAVTFPLRLCGGDGRYDLYAVLLDCATFSQNGTLFFGRIVLETAYGRLYAACTAANGVRFSHAAEGAAFPLLFCEQQVSAPDLLGSALYALPLRELPRIGRLFRGEDDDYATFFSHLNALGVRAIWLCPPAGEETDGRWDPSHLPPAFRSFAEKNGIRLLFDLLFCSGVRDAGRFVSHMDTLPLTAPGEGVDDRPGFWNMPALPQGESGSVQEYFCGTDGVVFRALRAGGGGLFLRAADRFGDALLSAIRSCLGSAVFLGAVNGIPFPIQLGARRRYLFGGALDGICGDELRDACLSYLVSGEGAALAHYLGDVLPSLPAHALAMQAQPLSLYESGSFLTAISEAYEEREPKGGGDVPRLLAELGHLIAGTLPGLPMYLAGEENGLPYPPTQGEAVGGQLAFFLRLAQLRRREPVYRDGLFRLLHLSPDLLVFSREREGEALLTVINRSSVRLSVASPDGFSVVFGGRGLKNVFSVRPFGGIVIKVSRWEGEPCRLRFAPDTVGETSAAAVAAPLVAWRVSRYKKT
ncbi:MAG: hypothetical protein IJY20_07105 [Clostridia bacterium]|nr:hypothetical protein [Clostridia bacterium]